VEGNETFTLNLGTPTNATIADAQGIATITNDDAAPPPNGTNGLTETVKITSDWGSGFTAEVSVINSGASLIDDWIVKFDMPYDIVNIWNAEIVSHIGDTYTVRNASWNDQIAPGNQITFGFQASPGHPNLSDFEWLL
jgi:chitinase